jgi:hypothetical protein
LAAVCPIRARPGVFAGIRKPLWHRGFGRVRADANDVWVGWQTG